MENKWDIPKVKKEPVGPSPDRGKILEMSPKELAAFFVELDGRGELEGFLEKAAEDDVLFAQFSYWEKWLATDQRNLVDQVVAQKRDAYGEKSDGLPLNLEKKFTPEQLRYIFANLGAIQLTFGCSKGCPFCGFDALPGKREHIPYSQLVNLFREYGSDFTTDFEIGWKGPLLYWASEPSDYADKEGLEDRTYKDVHQLAVNYAGYDPEITTKDSDADWLSYLRTRDYVRISVFGLSESKLNDIKRSLAEGDEQLGFVKLIGEDAKHLKGIGQSSLDADLSDKERSIERGIGCFDGTLLTPRGIYSVVQMRISSIFPQGQAIVPLETLDESPIEVGDSITKILSRGVPEFVTRAARVLYDDQESGEYFKEVFIRKGNKKYLVYFDNMGVAKIVEEYDDTNLEHVFNRDKRNREIEMPEMSYDLLGMIRCPNNKSFAEAIDAETMVKIKKLLSEFDIFTMEPKIEGDLVVWSSNISVDSDNDFVFSVEYNRKKKKIASFVAANNVNKGEELEVLRRRFGLLDKKST